MAAMASNIADNLADEYAAQEIQFPHLTQFAFVLHLEAIVLLISKYDPVSSIIVDFLAVLSALMIWIVCFYNRMCSLIESNYRIRDLISTLVVFGVVVACVCLLMTVKFHDSDSEDISLNLSLYTNSSSSILNQTSNFNISGIFKFKSLKSEHTHRFFDKYKSLTILILSSIGSLLWMFDCGFHVYVLYRFRTGYMPRFITDIKEYLGIQSAGALTPPPPGIQSVAFSSSSDGGQSVPPVRRPEEFLGIQSAGALTPPPPSSGSQYVAPSSSAGGQSAPPSVAPSSSAGGQSVPPVRPEIMKSVLRNMK